MKINRSIKVGIVLLVVVLSVSCSTKINKEESHNSVTNQRNNRYYWNDEEKYTKEDYNFLKELAQHDLEKITVYDFNKIVLNQDNEEEYHKNEKIIQRLYQSLEETDELYPFLESTLYTSWVESEKSHYNKCEENKYPFFVKSQDVSLYEDVYGNSELTQQISFSIDFNYQIKDQKMCTVAKRDAILDGVSLSLKSYIEEQGFEKLYHDPQLTKVLLEQLNKILGTLNDEIQWMNVSDLHCWVYSSEDVMEEVEVNNTEREFDYTKKYSKEQYNKLVDALVIENYKEMSIEDFDRIIYNTFNEDSENYYDSISFLYDFVLNQLEETDPHYDYLLNIIPFALKEYNAKRDEVLSKKDHPIEFYNNLSIQIKGKVYEDEIIKGELYLYYTFTYRILDAKQCTVADKINFIENVNKELKEYIQNNLSNNISEEALQKEFKSIGNSLSNDKIQFVDAKIESFEAAY
ncbi:hypothetical protein [Anaerorhabdus furcosa]|uniref:Lipoprotein n=1 Tax=Anaerorhabdus furcosa TaxID=118967 RepID=A0A1T4QCM0_9FIRM|nr:hypothetical protein [Anaerorhabdus furcosa]SKA01291.1 hypothetical protein SAMN02745191_2401 [Anaerorhabdus furcosa]